LIPKNVTLAERLKEAGYATGHFGKWHLGPEPYSPLQQGFDVDVPHHAGPGPAGSFVAPWKFKDFKERAPGEHIEDRMAAEAVAWMEKERARPFFLNYWMFSVHAPFDAKKALIEKYRSRVDPKDPQRSPTYAAMVQSKDDAVGTLLDALDRLGIADRTAVVFYSDNGGNMYNEIDGTTPTSNRPLRGGKTTMWEGGIRVPCVVSWPGVTRAGTRSEAMIQSADFYPTTLSLLGLPPTPNHPIDGVNITARCAV
jgi:arylsulfatase A-like enzyme